MTKKKLRQVKCPELDDLVTKYIVSAEAKLSQYGIGLSWGVVQARALKIAKELNENGTMSDDDFYEFSASRGWVEKLKTRRNLSLMKLVGKANTLSVVELGVAILLNAGMMNKEGKIFTHKLCTNNDLNCRET